MMSRVYMTADRMQHPSDGIIKPTAASQLNGTFTFRSIGTRFVQQSAKMCLNLLQFVVTVQRGLKIKHKVRIPPHQ